MQPLTASPRGAWTAAQVTALLVAPDLQVDFGVELLDADLTVIEDISADVSGGAVSRDNLADVHGTVELTISRELAWGRDRVRPYMVQSSATAGVTGCRFNQGVFLLTTPDRPLDQLPVTYSVTGYDQLHLLQDNIGDSYSVASGVNVLAAVTAVLTAAGITAPILLDTSASAKTLAKTRTWPQTSSESPTWIEVANKLLSSIGYRGLWCDWNGAFRSEPYVAPASRPSEWTFDVGDLRVGIVAANRSVSADVWGVPNWWRFIRNQDTTPVEGSGRYTTENLSTGPSSQASVGRIVRAPVTYLDATSQADLVTQGDKVKAAAMSVPEIITARLSPFPIAWHFDRCTYSDAALGTDRQAQCRSWSLPLTGEDMDYVLESVA